MAEKVHLSRGLLVLPIVLRPIDGSFEVRLSDLLARSSCGGDILKCVGLLFSEDKEVPELPELPELSELVEPAEGRSVSDIILLF